MTKDEMVTLLRSVNCDENTVTAMTNAYEMGFEQGAALSDLAQDLIEEARDVLNTVDNEEVADTEKFWGLFHKMKGLT
jgi:hypothetical protein